MTNHRTYETTHPWITFNLDLRRAPYRLWILLGEVQSKCDHIAGVPLQPVTYNELQLVYLAKGAHATTAIEGNTLTEEDALQIIDGTLELPESQKYLEKEITNIIAAYDQMLEELSYGELPDLSVDRIMEFNSQVLEDLEVEGHVVPGEITNQQVGVGRYRGAPPEDCLFLLEELCNWLNRPDFDDLQNQPVIQGVIKAIVAHIYLVWIHPFGDGNGRTARLMESQFLLSAGVPSPAVHLLSDHYNSTRQLYYRQLDAARETGSGLLNFFEYAVAGFLEGLQEQITKIQHQQLNISWRDYIRDQFRNLKGNADRRRRQLIYDVSLFDEAVSYEDITHVSPNVAELYATLTRRTLLRDISKLIDMELLRQTPAGIKANKEIMLTFLPQRAPVSNED